MHNQLSAISRPPWGYVPRKQRAPERDPGDGPGSWEKPGHKLGRPRSSGTRRRRHLPGGSVKFEGKNDVAAVADLADEAALGAQVAVVDVMGSKLEQRLQEGLKDAVGYLRGRDRSGRRGACLPPGLHCAKSTLHPFFELLREDKAVLQNQPKTHVPGSQQDPREQTAAPTTCQDGAPSFGVGAKSNHPSPPTLFAIDTSLRGDALAAMPA